MGKPKKSTDEPVKRDRYSETVAKNLAAMLKRREMSTNKLQIAVRELSGSTKSSNVSDFLDGGRTASLQVATLGHIADALEVPITAFFVPPDKRDDLMDILRTLGNGEILRPDQAGALVQALLEAKTMPLQAKDEEAEADTEQAPITP